MKSFHKWIALTLCLGMVAAMMAGCGNKPAPSAGGSSSAPAADKKTSFVFYGNRTGEDSWATMIDETIKLHPELDVQVIDIDWGNIDKILKTGIASGNPPDATHYWPMLIKPYVDAKQALDLTPYLTANNNEWMDTFEPSLLEMGKIDGKYYAVPYQSAFPTFYVNVDLFKAAGVAVPDGMWTWADFMAACEKLKAHTGVAPFSLAREVNSWLNRLGAVGMAKDDGKLVEFVSGQMDLTQNYLPETMENIKALYDAKYWYPGDGALNVTRDEARTAFVQGKAAILAEVNLQYPDLMNQVDFEIAPVLWPTMSKTTTIVGGADGFMIPANAAHVDEAVAFLKTFLSADIQKIRADSSYPVAVKGAEVTDPVVQELMTQTAYVVPEDYLNISAKMNDYVDKQLNANYILDNSERALQDVEALRQQAVG